MFLPVSANGDPEVHNQPLQDNTVVWQLLGSRRMERHKFEIHAKVMLASLQHSTAATWTLNPIAHSLKPS